MVDWNSVEQLLGIVDKSKDHPKLQVLTNAALSELAAHAEAAAEEIAADLKTKADAEKEAAEAAQAKGDKEAAAEQKVVEPQKPIERPISDFIRRPTVTAEQTNGA